MVFCFFYSLATVDAYRHTSPNALLHRLAAVTITRGMRGDSCEGKARDLSRTLSPSVFQTASCCLKRGERTKSWKTTRRQRLGLIFQGNKSLLCCDCRIIFWYFISLATEKLNTVLSLSEFIFLLLMTIRLLPIYLTSENLFVMEPFWTGLAAYQKWNEVSEQMFPTVPSRSLHGAFCNPAPKAHMYFYLWPLDH